MFSQVNLNSFIKAFDINKNNVIDMQDLTIWGLLLSISNLMLANDKLNGKLNNNCGLDFFDYEEENDEADIITTKNKPVNESKNNSTQVNNEHPVVEQKDKKPSQQNNVVVAQNNTPITQIEEPAVPQNEDTTANIINNEEPVTAKNREPLATTEKERVNITKNNAAIPIPRKVDPPITYSHKPYDKIPTNNLMYADTANGEVDQDFSQGMTGDCWLLASIKSLSNTEKGRQILKKSLTVNNDGSVTVNLQGVKKQYTISQYELKSRNDLSSGDMDVRALEIAVEKYMNENSYSNLPAFNSFDGNKMSTAYEILTGKGGNLIKSGINFLGDYLFGISDGQIDRFNDPNTIHTAAAVKSINKISSGRGEDISSMHAYSILGSDKDYVYLVNPHNTANTIKLTRDEFKDCFNSVESVKLD